MRSLIRLKNVVFSNWRLFRGVSCSFKMGDVEMTSANWRGVPLSEIIGSQSPWGAPEFPLVTPSHNHTVLYHIPSSGSTGNWVPTPQRSQEKWDSDHVRMPCSNKSLYPVESADGETCLKKRWEMIEEALRKPMLNSLELADAILSYNTKFKTIWKFTALHALFNDHLDEEVSNYFFQVTLPQIANLALRLPKLIQAPIPLLKQGKNHSISLTQEQVASLLANAFFCTFPRRNTRKWTSEYASYPLINFSTLFECSPNENVLEKLTCYCHYFKKVCSKAPRGVVTFSRRSAAPKGKGWSDELPRAGLAPGEPARSGWALSRAPLAEVPLHVDPDGKIEDAHGLIQLDFANKFLGGGVLRYGCVQEEIRFAICPELMLSMLFTEVLRPDEALLMIGCVRYSSYSGYGSSFRWTGPYEEPSPLDSSGRHRVAVLALDAAPYRRRDTQYRPDMIRRELLKAWVGFSFYTSGDSLQYPGLATGNWGCGAFGGSADLKALLQLMAAAQTKRPMAYYTFGDQELRDKIITMYELLARHNLTVGELYECLMQYSCRRPPRGDLHSFIRGQLEGTAMDTSTSPKELKNSRIKKQKEPPRNVSPDLFSLFSQDDDSEQHSEPNNSSLKPNKNQNSKQQPTSENNMASQTRRLFNELQKFDEESGKLNLKSSDITSRYFDCPKENIVIPETPDSDQKDECKASGSQQNTQNETTSKSKMVESKNKMAATTSRLLDEMQKLDSEQGELKLSVRSAARGSGSSLDSDKSDAPPEVKRKFTRKITDYFSKKTT